MIERDATWQPIDITPMHPEYPYAHCCITCLLREPAARTAKHNG